MSVQPKFVPVRIDSDVDSVPALVQIVNRIQQAVALSFEKIVPPELSVHVVNGTYTATEADSIIIADPSHGPCKIVMDVPNNKQIVTIMNRGGSNNPVTVVRTDGKTFDGAGAVLNVDKLKSLAVTCDGTDWFELI